MKRLLIVLSILALNGCALYDAYMMTGFDSNEYRVITEIRTDAGIYKTQCNNPVLSASNSAAMANKTALFQNYSEEIPRNSNGVNASRELNKIAQGLAEKYTGSTEVSPIFCKLKYQSIESSAKTIQHVVGSRPR